MSDLRKAAEQALEALETLWDILDDIDTASDMAKENDAWYRKRVEALQKKRWDTTITTDGYKLKGGPVEALRQALAQHVDAVNMTQESVDKTEKCEHEPVAIVNEGMGGIEWLDKPLPDDIPLYTAPPKREWVGLTGNEAKDFYEKYTNREELIYAIDEFLEEKNT